MVKKPQKTNDKPKKPDSPNDDFKIEQLFGSKTRARLLSLFLENPQRRFYVRELTRRIDAQLNSVRRELQNLVGLGIILEVEGKILEEEGAVNGLNGVMIGVAQSKGISGVCLMGDITYANVPQHLASKAVLEVLVKLLKIEIDTNQLNIRAKKIDASIKKRLDIFEEEEEELMLPEDKRLGYIS